ncbi:MAG: hypothetical protein Q9162_003999 [Coniocarpon cinnabarinum]
MAAIQLSFSLKTSSSCKTVHLLGNWDGYKGQLPLSKDSKPGCWRGTFRFQGSTLQQGKRYWYYYIIDGYKVSHDAGQPSTVEPTTKRTLNILDIPDAKGNRPSAHVSSRTAKRTSTVHRDSTHADVPHGRSLSPSKIIAPRPQKPHETRRLANARYSGSDVDKISHKLAATHVSSSSFSSSEEDSSEYSDSEIESDASSDLPSLTSNSSRGSPISPASPASSVCSCDRWGVNKRGARVKLDCGGSRCGSSGSDLSSSDSEGEYMRQHAKLDARKGESRRHGVVVRHSRR